MFRQTLRWIGCIVAGGVLCAGAWFWVQGGLFETDVLKGLSWLPEPKRPITVMEVSHQELEQRLAHRRRQERTRTDRCRRLALVELGLVDQLEQIEPRAGLFAHRPGASSSLAGAAFYRTGSDTIVVDERLRIALRHEWIHALEDQYTDRLAALREASTTDEALALHAVVEGTASLFAEGRLPEQRSLFKRPFAGTLDAAAYGFLYRRGVRYVYGRAGSDLQAAWELRPSTTYELLFPDASAPTIQEVPPATVDGDRLCGDRLGALAVLTTANLAGMNPRDAVAVARGWSGDRVEMFSTAEGRKVVWTVLFDSQRAADLWRVGPMMQWEWGHPVVDMRAGVVSSAP